MEKNSRFLFLILISFVFSGCTVGLLYNDTTVPYCTNMKQTPNDTKAGSRPLKRFSIPTIPGTTVRWNSNTINDIAKTAGIKKVAYCDRKVYRILNGLWEKDSIIVYGK